MAKNPELTKKLLLRHKKMTGELKEEDQKELMGERRASSEKNGEEAPLLEAQQDLLSIKNRYPFLSEHVDHAYTQIGQIISILRRRREANGNRGSKNT